VYTHDPDPEPERKIVTTRTLPVEPITFKPVPDEHPIEPEPAVRPAYTIPDRVEPMPDPDPTVPLWGADKMPAFGNGYADMEAYIRKHIRYPARAVKDGIEGTVFVEFVVDAEGYVKDARVVHGIRRDLDEEALRVVRSMPRWEPGINKGFPVPVRQTMPITYKLNRY
jgi:protein TonB